MISCSQQKATKAEFSFTIGAISTSSFPGGLMIYGQNATKTAIFGQRHFSGPMALDLQNGDWQFFAVGWSGTSPMTGATRCALASAKLAGEPVSVNLNLTASNCALPAFVPSSAFLANANPQALSIHACNDLAGLTAASNCSGRVSEHRSFRVIFPSYRGSANNVEHLQASDLVGTCISANAAGLAATTNTIPVGNGRFFLATEIQAFTSTNCSGDAYGYLFKNGLSLGDDDGETLVFDAGNITNVFVLFDTVTAPAPPPPPVVTGPAAPSTLSLLSAPISTGISVSIAVSGGLAPTGVVTLHADMACMSTPIGTQTFTGDPMTVTFNVLTDGMYNVYAKQTVAGVESACSSANVLFTIDATPPSPPTSLSWTSGSVTNVPSIQLSWTPASDIGSGLIEQEISLFSEAACITPSGTSVTLSPGPTSYSFTSLVDGTYYAKVIAKDAALNTAPSNCSPPITIDRVAPLAATTLNIPMGPTNMSTISLTWTKSMSPDLSGQELLVSNDSMCTSVTNTIPLTAADWGYPLAVTSGFYSYKVRSIDLAGNMSESMCSSSIEVDQTISPPASLALAAPTTSPGNDSTISVVVSGVEDGAIVTVYQDSLCTNQISSSASGASGQAIVMIDTLSVEQTYTFYAKQVDIAGNVSTCSASSVTYVFDITPPATPTILGVTGASDTIVDSLFSGMSSMTFHWQPQAGVQSYQVVVIDQFMATHCSMFEASGASTQFQYPSCSVGPDATYTVKLSARDAAGNFSPQASMDFTGSWLFTPFQLTQPMTDHKAVRDNTGRIITWGGYVGGVLSNQGFITNTGVTSATPVTLTNVPSARRGHAMVYNGTETLIAGGDNGSGTFNNFFSFTGTSWTLLPNIPYGNTSDMAYGYSTTASKFVLWGGRVLPSTYLTTGAAWDGSTWADIGPASLAGRAYTAFGVTGDYFIVWGGRGMSAEFSDGAYYKFSMNQWYPMAPSPLAGRFNTSHTIVNGNLLVWGGQKVDGTRFNDGAIYNPATNTWFPLSTVNAPPPLSETMVATDGDKVYFRGGINSVSAPMDISFMYDLATNQWNPLVDLNRPAGVVGGVFMDLGTQLILIGGKDISGNPSTNVRLLKPAP